MLDQACKKTFKNLLYSVYLAIQHLNIKPVKCLDLIQGFIPDWRPEARAGQRSGQSLQILFTLLKDLEKQ